MWNIENLKVKNLFSHAESEFTFPKDKLTIILGENQDDKLEGAESNGSGKSVLIEGITIGLTGESYRDITQDEFIKDGEVETFVSIQLHNTFTKKRIRIDWEFKKKKSAKPLIYEDDSKEPLKNIVSVADAKKYILDAIGIGRDDLLEYFIINQGNNTSFFTEKDAKQKETILRFLS